MKRFIQNIVGATAIEYSLIAGLIAIAAVAAMQAVGNGSLNNFNTAASAFS